MEAKKNDLFSPARPIAPQRSSVVTGDSPRFIKRMASPAFNSSLNQNMTNNDFAGSSSTTDNADPSGREFRGVRSHEVDGEEPSLPRIQASPETIERAISTNESLPTSESLPRIKKGGTGTESVFRIEIDKSKGQDVDWATILQLLRQDPSLSALRIPDTLVYSKQNDRWLYFRCKEKEHSLWFSCEYLNKKLFIQSLFEESLLKGNNGNVAVAMKLVALPDDASRQDLKLEEKFNGYNYALLTAIDVFGLLADNSQGKLEDNFIVQRLVRSLNSEIRRAVYETDIFNGAVSGGVRFVSGTDLLKLGASYLQLLAVAKELCHAFSNHKNFCYYRLAIVCSLDLDGVLFVENATAVMVEAPRENPELRALAAEAISLPKVSSASPRPNERGVLYFEHSRESSPTNSIDDIVEPTATGNLPFKNDSKRTHDELEESSHVVFVDAGRPVYHHPREDMERANQRSIVSTVRARQSFDVTSNLVQTLSWPQLLMKLRHCGQELPINIPETVFFCSDLSMPLWVSAFDNDLILRRNFATDEIIDKLRDGKYMASKSSSWNKPKVVAMLRTSMQTFLLTDQELRQLFVGDQVAPDLKATGSFLQSYLLPFDEVDEFVVCRFKNGVDVSSITEDCDFVSLAKSSRFDCYSKGFGEVQYRKLKNKEILGLLQNSSRRLLNLLWKKQNYFPLELAAEFIMDSSGVLWLCNVSSFKYIEMESLDEPREPLFEAKSQSRQNSPEKKPTAEVTSLPSVTKNIDSSSPGESNAQPSNVRDLSRRCIKCQSELELPTSKFCWNCGYKLQSMDQSEELKSIAPTKSTPVREPEIIPQNAKGVSRQLTIEFDTIDNDRAIVLSPVRKSEYLSNSQASPQFNEAVKRQEIKHQQEEFDQRREEEAQWKLSLERYNQQIQSALSSRQSGSVSAHSMSKQQNSARENHYNAEDTKEANVFGDEPKLDNSSNVRNEDVPLPPSVPLYSGSHVYNFDSHAAKSNEQIRQASDNWLGDASHVISIDGDTTSQLEEQDLEKARYLLGKYEEETDHWYFDEKLFAYSNDFVDSVNTAIANNTGNLIPGSSPVAITTFQENETSFSPSRAVEKSIVGENEGSLDVPANAPVNQGLNQLNPAAGDWNKPKLLNPCDIYVYGFQDFLLLCCNCGISIFPTMDTIFRTDHLTEWFLHDRSQDAVYRKADERLVYPIMLKVQQEFNKQSGDVETMPVSLMLSQTGELLEFLNAKETIAALSTSLGLWSESMMQLLIFTPKRHIFQIFCCEYKAPDGMHQRGNFKFTNKYFSVVQRQHLEIEYYYCVGNQLKTREGVVRLEDVGHTLKRLTEFKDTMEECIGKVLELYLHEKREQVVALNANFLLDYNGVLRLSSMPVIVTEQAKTDYAVVPRYLNVFSQKLKTKKERSLAQPAELVEIPFFEFLVSAVEDHEVAVKIMPMIFPTECDDDLFVLHSRKGLLTAEFVSTIPELIKSLELTSDPFAVYTETFVKMYNVNFSSECYLSRDQFSTIFSEAAENVSLPDGCMMQSFVRPSEMTENSLLSVKFGEKQLNAVWLPVGGGGAVNGFGDLITSSIHRTKFIPVGIWAKPWSSIKLMINSIRGLFLRHRKECKSFTAVFVIDRNYEAWLSHILHLKCLVRDDLPDATTTSSTEPFASLQQNVKVSFQRLYWWDIANLLSEQNQIDFPCLDAVFHSPDVNDFLSCFAFDAEKGRMEFQESSFFSISAVRRIREFSHANGNPRGELPIGIFCDENGRLLKLLKEVNILKMLDESRAEDWNLCFLQPTVIFSSEHRQIAALTGFYRADNNLGCCPGDNIKLHCELITTPRTGQSSPEKVGSNLKMESEFCDGMLYCNQFSCAERCGHLAQVRSIIHALVHMIEHSMGAPVISLAAKFMIASDGYLFLSAVPFALVRDFQNEPTALYTEQVPTLEDKKPTLLKPMDEKPATVEATPLPRVDEIGPELSSVLSNPETIEVEETATSAKRSAQSLVEPPASVPEKTKTEEEISREEVTALAEKIVKKVNTAAPSVSKKEKAKTVQFKLETRRLLPPPIKSDAAVEPPEKKAAKPTPRPPVTLDLFPFAKLLEFLASSHISLSLKIPPTVILDGPELFQLIFSDSSGIPSAKKEIPRVAITATLRKLISGNDGEGRFPIVTYQEDGTRNFLDAKSCKKLLSHPTLQLTKSGDSIQLSVGKPMTYFVCVVNFGDKASYSLIDEIKGRFGTRDDNGMVQMMSEKALEGSRLTPVIQKRVVTVVGVVLESLLKLREITAKTMMVDFALDNSGKPWLSNLLLMKARESKAVAFPGAKSESLPEEEPTEELAPDGESSLVPNENEGKMDHSDLTSGIPVASDASMLQPNEKLSFVDLLRICASMKIMVRIKIPSTIAYSKHEQQFQLFFTDPEGYMRVKKISQLSFIWDKVLKAGNGLSNENCADDTILASLCHPTGERELLTKAACRLMLEELENGSTESPLHSPNVYFQVFPPFAKFYHTCQYACKQPSSVVAPKVVFSNRCLDQTEEFHDIHQIIRSNPSTLALKSVISFVESIISEVGNRFSLAVKEVLLSFAEEANKPWVVDIGLIWIPNDETDALVKLKSTLEEVHSEELSTGEYLSPMSSRHENIPTDNSAEGAAIKPGAAKSESSLPLTRNNNQESSQLHGRASVSTSSISTLMKGVTKLSQLRDTAPIETQENILARSIVKLDENLGEFACTLSFIEFLHVLARLRVPLSIKLIPTIFMRPPRLQFFYSDGESILRKRKDVDSGFALKVFKSTSDSASFDSSGGAIVWEGFHKKSVISMTECLELMKKRADKDAGMEKFLLQAQVSPSFDDYFVCRVSYREDDAGLEDPVWRYGRRISDEEFDLFPLSSEGSTEFPKNLPGSTVKELEEAVSYMVHTVKHRLDGNVRLLVIDFVVAPHGKLWIAAVVPSMTLANDDEKAKLLNSTKSVSETELLGSAKELTSSASAPSTSQSPKSDLFPSASFTAYPTFFPTIPESNDLAETTFEMADGDRSGLNFIQILTLMENLPLFWPMKMPPCAIYQQKELLLVFMNQQGKLRKKPISEGFLVDNILKTGPGEKYYSTAGNVVIASVVNIHSHSRITRVDLTKTVCLENLQRKAGFPEIRKENAYFIVLPVFGLVEQYAFKYNFKDKKAEFCQQSALFETVGAIQDSDVELTYRKPLVEYAEMLCETIQRILLVSVSKCEIQFCCSDNNKQLWILHISVRLVEEGPKDRRLTFVDSLKCLDAAKHKLALELAPTIALNNSTGELLLFCTDESLCVRKRTRVQTEFALEVFNLAASDAHDVVNEVTVAACLFKNFGVCQYLNLQECRVILMEANRPTLRDEDTYLQVFVTKSVNFVCHFICESPGSIANPNVRFGQRNNLGAVEIFEGNRLLLSVVISESIQKKVTDATASLVKCFRDALNIMVIQLSVIFVVVEEETIWITSIMPVVEEMRGLAALLRSSSTDATREISADDVRTGIRLRNASISSASSKGSQGQLLESTNVSSKGQLVGLWKETIDVGVFPYVDVLLILAKMKFTCSTSIAPIIFSDRDKFQMVFTDKDGVIRRKRAVDTDYIMKKLAATVVKEGDVMGTAFRNGERSFVTKSDCDKFFIAKQEILDDGKYFQISVSDSQDCFVCELRFPSPRSQEFSVRFGKRSASGAVTFFADESQLGAVGLSLKVRSQVTESISKISQCMREKTELLIACFEVDFELSKFGNVCITSIATVRATKFPGTEPDTSALAVPPASVISLPSNLSEQMTSTKDSITGSSLSWSATMDSAVLANTTVESIASIKEEPSEVNVSGNIGFVEFLHLLLRIRLVTGLRFTSTIYFEPKKEDCYQLLYLEPAGTVRKKKNIQPEYALTKILHVDSKDWNQNELAVVYNLDGTFTTLSAVGCTQYLLPSETAAAKLKTSGLFLQVSTLSKKFFQCRCICKSEKSGNSPSFSFFEQEFNITSTANWKTAVSLPDNVRQEITNCINTTVEGLALRERIVASTVRLDFVIDHNGSAWMVNASLGVDNVKGVRFSSRQSSRATTPSGRDRQLGVATTAVLAANAFGRNPALAKGIVPTSSQLTVTTENQQEDATISFVAGTTNASENSLPTGDIASPQVPLNPLVQASPEQTPISTADEAKQDGATNSLVAGTTNASQNLPATVDNITSQEASSRLTQGSSEQQTAPLVDEVKQPGSTIATVAVSGETVKSFNESATKTKKNEDGAVAHNSSVQDKSGSTIPESFSPVASRIATELPAEPIIAAPQSSAARDIENATTTENSAQPTEEMKTMSDQAPQESTLDSVIAETSKIEAPLGQKVEWSLNVKDFQVTSFPEYLIQLQQKKCEFDVKMPPMLIFMPTTKLFKLLFIITKMVKKKDNLDIAAVMERVIIKSSGGDKKKQVVALVSAIDGKRLFMNTSECQDVLSHEHMQSSTKHYLQVMVGSSTVSYVCLRRRESTKAPWTTQFGWRELKGAVFDLQDESHPKSPSMKAGLSDAMRAEFDKISDLAIARFTQLFPDVLLQAVFDFVVDDNGTWLINGTFCAGKEEDRSTAQAFSQPDESGTAVLGSHDSPVVVAETPVGTNEETKVDASVEKAPSPPPVPVEPLTVKSISCNFPEILLQLSTQKAESKIKLLPTIASDGETEVFRFFFTDPTNIVRRKTNVQSAYLFSKILWKGGAKKEPEKIIGIFGQKDGNLILKNLTEAEAMINSETLYQNEGSYLQMLESPAPNVIQCRFLVRNLERKEFSSLFYSYDRSLQKIYELSPSHASMISDDLRDAVHQTCLLFIAAANKKYNVSICSLHLDLSISSDGMSLLGARNWTGVSRPEIVDFGEFNVGIDSSDVLSGEVIPVSTEEAGRSMEKEKTISQSLPTADSLSQKVDLAAASEEPSATKSSNEGVTVAAAESNVATTEKLKEEVEEKEETEVVTGDRISFCDLASMLARVRLSLNMPITTLVIFNKDSSQLQMLYDDGRTNSVRKKKSIKPAFVFEKILEAENADDATVLAYFCNEEGKKVPVNKQQCKDLLLNESSDLYASHQSSYLQVAVNTTSDDCYVCDGRCSTNGEVDNMAFKFWKRENDGRSKKSTVKMGLSDPHPSLAISLRQFAVEASEILVKGIKEKLGMSVISLILEFVPVDGEEKIMITGIFPVVVEYSGSVSASRSTTSAALNPADRATTSEEAKGGIRTASAPQQDLTSGLSNRVLPIDADASPRSATPRESNNTEKPTAEVSFQPSVRSTTPRTETPGVTAETEARRQSLFTPASGSRPSTTHRLNVSLVDLCMSLVSQKCEISCSIPYSVASDTRGKQLHLVFTDKTFIVRKKKNVSSQFLEDTLVKPIVEYGNRKGYDAQTYTVAYLYDKDRLRTPLNQEQIKEVMDQDCTRVKQSGACLIFSVADKAPDEFFCEYVCATPGSPNGAVARFAQREAGVAESPTTFFDPNDAESFLPLSRQKALTDSLEELMKTMMTSLSFCLEKGVIEFALTSKDQVYLLSLALEVALAR